MFLIVVIGLSLSWVLIKFGALSATVGILTVVIKVLLMALLVGSIAAAWFWLRKKISQPGNGQ